MASIKIQRSSEYLNRLRDYQIYIDGQKIGTIANGETKEFDISNSHHSVVAKIDWCSSQEITFDFNKTETKLFKVSGFKNGNWLLPIGLFIIVLGFILNRFLDNELSMYFTFLGLPVFALLLYYLTIGRKKYLTLIELN